MDFKEYSQTTRANIAEALSHELTKALDRSPSFSGDSAQIFSLLDEYEGAGKMLRGILACLSTQLCGTTNPGNLHTEPFNTPEDYRLGAALELFQAGLLIHDDIMDGDSLRRGLPTLHKKFETLYSTAEVHKPAHLGEALGICAGDICFFLAWELLAEYGPQMLRLFSRELVSVCLAQSKDVSSGAIGSFPDLKTVLEIYTYKTARYTICLPLCAGAIAAGRPEICPYLEEIGLNLGILFQLKDDSLGLFGNESHIGKPIGSDLREGKKTPHILLLYPKLSSNERSKFDGIFGRQNITDADVSYVRGLICSHGVDTYVEKMESDYAIKAEEALNRLIQTFPDLNSRAITLIKDFVSYSLSRQN